MQYSLIAPYQNDLSAVEQVLVNRGFKIEDIEHYLTVSEKDEIEPLKVAQITEAVKMVMKHIANKDKIFVQVDCDADGYTSAAVFINYLYQLFPGFAQQYITYRLQEDKTHGLILDTIPKDVKLVVAPDSSSNQYNEHKELAAAGIDVLVIDHHEADKVSEYACVVNNQLCDYPTKSLSGVGMVYKFCEAFDELTGQYQADNFIDLVALGVISDMMDLKDFETHYYVEKGLQNIRNPFFKQMIHEQSYSIDKKGGLKPFTVSFYITPLINAVTRVGKKKKKTLLFESMLDFKAYNQIPSTKRGCKGQMETLVEQACRTAKNVKSRQGKIQDENLENVENLIKRNNLLKHKLLVICLDDPIDSNLTGLIANQIASKYQHPTLLLNDKGDTWGGSGRNFAYSPLEDFRTFCNNTTLVELAQGHASAFGFAIKKENLDKFIKLTDVALKDMEFQQTYKVDFIWNGNNFNPNNVTEIGSLSDIWGEGIKEPLIAIEHINCCSNNCFMLRNNTMKITMYNGLTLMKFGVDEEEFIKLAVNEGRVEIAVIGTCNVNIWNGNISPQIMIEDYEITNRQEYYF